MAMRDGANEHSPPGVSTADEAAAPPVVSDVPRPAGESRSGGLTPLTLLLTIVLAYFLFKVQSVVVLLIAGILFATAISGPVEWLHRRFRLHRGIAVLIVYLLALAALAGLIALIAPSVAREGTRFAEDVPGMLDSYRGQLLGSNNSIVHGLATWLFDLLDRTNLDLASVPTNFAVEIAQGVGGGIVTFFTLFLIAFYWTTEKATVKRAVTSLFRSQHRQRARRLWDEVEEKLGAWLRGQLLLMAVIGAITTAAYGVMGLPFWLMLGVIAGLTEAIPNVGPVLGAIPAVLLALTVSWRMALAVVVFVIVLQMLENAVLVPRIMRGAVGLTPLTVILAILAGAEFMGVVGALLAVPIAGAVQVIVSDLLREPGKPSDGSRLRGDWLRRELRRRAERGRVPLREPED